jgi:LAO/AO transport system kinase
MPSNDEGLWQKVLEGDERSAARLISLIEEGNEEGCRQLSHLFPHTGKAHVIGITGPPGVGKSTLTGGLATVFSDQGKKVGVIAVDPTSAFGRGAFLADRLRMKDAERKDIFIRSMAHRGYSGGVARATAGAVYVLEGLGKETILVESLGAGQTEKDLSHLCDTVILVFSPEYGDEMQLLKAGLMEIGDILVVNKSDRPGAENARLDLSLSSSNLQSKGGWKAPVLATRADRDEGLAALIDAIEAHWRFIAEGRREGLRKEKGAAFLTALLKEEVWRRFERAMKGSRACALVTEAAMARKIDPYSAVQRIVDKTAFSMGEEESKGE